MPLNPRYNGDPFDGHDIFDFERGRYTRNINEEEDYDSLYDSDDDSYRPSIFGTDRLRGRNRISDRIAGRGLAMALEGDLARAPDDFSHGFQFHRSGLDDFSRGRGVDMNDLCSGGSRRRRTPSSGGLSEAEREDDLAGFSRGFAWGGVRRSIQMPAEGYMGDLEEDLVDTPRFAGHRRFQRQQNYLEANPIGFGGSCPRRLRGNFNGELGQGLLGDLGDFGGRYGERGGGLFDGLNGHLGVGFGRGGFGRRGHGRRR